jgi:signal transduction histidine kinase
MTDSTAHHHRTGGAVFPRLFALPNFVVGAAYLVGYVGLDWISFIYPFASYNITPWNPPTGLSFLLILVFGLRMIPYLFVAPLLADLIVRQQPLPWTIEFATTAIIGCSYSLALLFLLRPKTLFNSARLSPRDLFLLLVAAAVSAAIVAFGYVAILVSFRFLSVEDFFAAGLRYWVGDMIGIAVITPFGLVVLMPDSVPKVSVETIAQFAAIIIAILLVFNLSQEQHLQLFYILFLPIVWLAVRAGLKGVAAGILVAQLGLIIGVRMLSETAVDVTAFQLLMLVLAMTGLIAGALVTERRRAEFQLRLQQDSLDRSARLRSMGELAAAVAHEINQPLMAAGTYSRLVRDALCRSRNSQPSIVEIAEKGVAQVERASEVVRRLRALLRLDKSDRSPVAIRRIVDDALDLCREDLDRCGISCRTDLEYNLPPVIVDFLQIELVVLNLVRNAMEAINEANPAGRVITIEAREIKSGIIELSVRDSGPGFIGGQATVELSPFATTKSTGFGIGLSLSRTIIEAHGGQLKTGSDIQGTVVLFTLPAVRRDQ